MWGSLQARQKLKSYLQNLEQGSDLCRKRTIQLHGLCSNCSIIHDSNQAPAICTSDAYHYRQFTTPQEFHKLRHQSSFDYNFYPVIGTIC